jgi:K+-sensing histidine kinase KdpD
VVAVAYGAQLVALILAYRFGLRVATDVRRLTAFVGALRSDEEWTSTGELPVLGAPLSTQPAEALNQAIVAVAERFARVANEETRVRGVLERAERLRPRFMAYVSHDLRGPLNSIKGFAEILSRGEDPPLSPEQRESLATIQESGEELLRLVTEIIDSTRLLEGRIELFPRWTPIVTLLTEAVGQVRLLRRRRPIELDTHLQPGLPVLRVDRARLVQALVSILAFLQHPLEEGAIHVNVRVIEARPGNPGVVRFEFRSSPGVDRGDGAHLFEALRPGRAPTGQRVAGLGVGLSLARGLVERHGGQLSYRPGLQQVGGCFVLDLPLPSEAD